MFNKYQVIKKAVSYDLANFCFNYFLLKRDAAKFMYDNNIIHDNGMFGTWGDTQIPNTYSHYADPVMETLLLQGLQGMREITGLNLAPTYSYWRFGRNIGRNGRTRCQEHGIVLSVPRSRPETVGKG